MKSVGWFIGGVLLGSYIMYNALFQNIVKVVFETKTESEENKSDDE